jgi:MFS family permease
MRERRWRLPRVSAIERWLVVPTLVSAAASGIAPMMLPLEIVEIEGRALHVGVVMASIGAGLLSAPLWSRLASRCRAHRAVMVAGALAVTASLVGFCLAREVHEWAALATLMGIGTAAVFTVSSLLITDRFPSEEQQARVGWLQTLATVGTMCGLVVAGGVSHLSLEPANGFAIGAGVTLAATLLAGALVPTVGSATSAAGETAVAGGPATPAASRANRILQPFTILLVLWVIAGLGVYGVGALYPLLMRREFHVEPAVSSYCLALATGLSTLLFVPSGALAARLGELRVLQGGLGLRLVSLTLLSFMAVTPLLERAWLAFIPYFSFLLAWPLLSISSVLLVARLGNRGGDSGIGMFSAVGAFASLAGPVVGGHAADTFGYTSVWLLAAAGVGLALLLSMALPRPVAIAVQAPPAAVLTAHPGGEPG